MPMKDATTEPFAARLYFIPKLIRSLQGFIVRVLRRYFERAPGWVLLTTRGRKTGLPREVLLPCERVSDGTMFVISTYGNRSDWIRNIRRDPAVRISCAGWVFDARAEIVEDEAAKEALVAANPFFVPMPLGWLNTLHRTVLRPLTVAFLRWWVSDRPVVIIRQLPGGAAPASRSL
jgi:deazaflavin-dependent oxidoreductase (nitroreductase family)